MSCLSLRSINDRDREFLFHLYATTREEEMSRTGWPAEQIRLFLDLQFTLQHAQFQQSYHHANFNVVELNNVSIGRVYVDRGPQEIRIIDIALLPTCRGKGFGSHLLRDLIAEADQKQAVLSLHVERHNPARRLYARLGWVETTDTGTHLRMEKDPAAPLFESRVAQ